MGMLVVLIDPGHGAETPGKRSPDSTLREYEFNRGVGRMVQKRLLDCGIDARLTVHDDSDLPLIRRTNQARDLKREGYQVLLLSIHANAYGNGWNTAQGIETFTNDQAEKLARSIQQQLVTETRLVNRGVKRANLHITRECARHGIPGVLVELGFMTNKDDCALLKTDAYREKCARALVKAICANCGVTYAEPQAQLTTVDKCLIEVCGNRLDKHGILRDGKSLLPVRTLADALGKGSLVVWDEKAKKVLLDGVVLESTELVDGTGYAMSMEIGAALGLLVEWDANTKTVLLGRK